ncbi:MAG TPA: hypothetical protein VHP37_02970 [Burkholderiales bacterium]|nr:hypothetical protein [Burkholderiales bacterium]
MKLCFWIAVMLLAASLTPACASNSEVSVWTGHECSRVKDVIVANGLSLRTLSKEQIYCESYIQNPSYVVLLARCGNCGSEYDGPGSSLIGYFALRRSDSRIFNWDFANDRIEGRGYSALPRHGSR